MAEYSISEANRIYDVMSKLASNAAMNAAIQTIALIQKAMKDEPNSPGLRALAGGNVLTVDETKILDEYDRATLNEAWRKVMRSVDISVGFVPELDREARTEGLLYRKGDIVRGQVDQILSPQANWEVEVDFGIIRGKVSW